MSSIFHVTFTNCLSVLEQKPDLMGKRVWWSVTLPHGTVCWLAVCDSGIS